MHMVGHQGIGVQRASFLAEGFTEPMEVRVVVLVGKEAGLAVVAALDDVQGDTVEVSSWATRHE